MAEVNSEAELEELLRTSEDIIVAFYYAKEEGREANEFLFCKVVYKGKVLNLPDGSKFQTEQDIWAMPLQFATGFGHGLLHCGVEASLDSVDIIINEPWLEES